MVSIGIDGTPSAASTVATATPGPTLGFDDLYKQAGGTGLGRVRGGGTDVARRHGGRLAGG